MENRAEFLKKLGNLVEVAKINGNKISVEEVQRFFSDEDLTEEQMELVFDYLLSQKVVVQGYLKLDEEEEVENTYTEEEQSYLEEYLNDLKAFKEEKVGEREQLIRTLVLGDITAKGRLVEVYLKDVVEIAKSMHCEEVFLGDLIQEGNMGLLVGLDTIRTMDKAHETIVQHIKEQMQALIAEVTDLSNRDKRMVEKVNALDEAIKTLSEELGRKVTIDELALYMGMSEEEIDDILRLMGEDSEEES